MTVTIKVRPLIQLSNDCLFHKIHFVQMFVPLQITPEGTADLIHPDTPLTSSTLLSFPFCR